MKLKVDYREKKLIKLLNVYLVQFNLNNIIMTVESLDVGDLIICDDDDKEREEGLHESWNNVPVSIAAIGICFEEYTYLTKSAIPTLSRGLIVDS